VSAPEREIPIVYLKPGEIQFSKDPKKIITILGSCLSIVMYSRRKKIGSTCHAVMPSLTIAKNQNGVRDAFQYVDSSAEWMLSRFEGAGVKRGDIDVKIFGGADMFSGRGNGTNSLAIGRTNVREVVRIISEQNLMLKAWNIGGRKGRKLIFYTDTGDVVIKFV
jgi:chemotaxis protein CheD